MQTFLMKTVSDKTISNLKRNTQKKPSKQRNIFSSFETKRETVNVLKK